MNGATIIVIAGAVTSLEENGTRTASRTLAPVALLLVVALASAAEVIGVGDCSHIVSDLERAVTFYGVLVGFETDQGLTEFSRNSESRAAAVRLIAAAYDPLGQRGYGRKQVVYKHEVGEGADWRLGIGIDRDDGARILDASEMLDRA